MGCNSVGSGVEERNKKGGKGEGGEVECGGVGEGGEGGERGEGGVEEGEVGRGGGDGGGWWRQPLPLLFPFLFTSTSSLLPSVFLIPLF